MPEIPEDEAENRRVETVTDGYFEEQYYVSAADAGEFLVSLGEQLQSGEDVTISGDDWELPFAYHGQVELEIEYDGGHDSELEIELELSGRPEDEAPNLG